jgi:hypothetical protein
VSDESLRHRLGCYGTVLEVDVKNRESPSPFAFVQFSDINSVVKTIQEIKAKQATSKTRLKASLDLRG